MRRPMARAREVLCKNGRKVGGICWVMSTEAVDHGTDLGDQRHQRLRTAVDEPINSTRGACELNGGAAAADAQPEPASTAASAHGRDRAPGQGRAG